MPSFLAEAMRRAIAEPGVPWSATVGYQRVSVKRRTWRTLWLVERTYRVKVPIVRVTLSTSSYSAEPPPPDPALVRHVTADGTYRA